MKPQAYSSRHSAARRELDPRRGLERRRPARRSPKVNGTDGHAHRAPPLAGDEEE